MSLKEKKRLSRNAQCTLFVILKKKLTPGVILTLPWGINIIVKQVYWCVSDLRRALSSGLLYELLAEHEKFAIKLRTSIFVVLYLKPYQYCFVGFMSHSTARVIWRQAWHYCMMSHLKDWRGLALNI